jgi:hypothetical protein
MHVLMHNWVFRNIVFAVVLLFTGNASAQTQEIQQIGHLIDDALIFSDKYITPATDAAVYQSASGWITSPKKPGLWEAKVALHVNVFFTPQKDRTFVINNSELSFFQLEEGSSAKIPTAVGNKHQVYLHGQLGDADVRLETPQGINMETVAYPYLQGSLGLPGGTSLVIKYSPQVNLKKSNYQVYGFGFMHNLTQHFKRLKENHINISVLAAWSKEDISVNFLNVQTAYGTLGINRINGLVDTFQFQASGSKEFGSWEAMGSIISSTSFFKYKVSGETGTIENIVPLQYILNTRLKEIYKTRINYIGEAAIKYNIGNFDIQTVLAFGKFVNTNVSLQYTIH